MRTHSLRRSWFRAVAVVLVPAHVAVSAPAFAEVAQAKAAAAANQPAPPPEVKVNRTVPKVTPPPLYPEFSAAATTAEITRARVFGEPLLPVGGTPSQDENTVLSRAITGWLHRGNPEDTSFFENFLVLYPSSPWRASLAANLGVVYDRHGYFARADVKFREAWAMTKDLETPQATAVAEQSISELLSMGMKFGKVEKLEELLAEVGERDTGGKAVELLKAAYSSAWELRHEHHKAIPSGPVALDRILARVSPGERRPKKISDFHATDDGASLAQIEKLAQDVDLPLRTAFRSFGGEIVVPAVVHLKAGHFSALVREEGGRYLLDDPLLGGEVWMSKGALDEESSGYFLIPEGPLPDGWRAANAAELASVRGKCVSVWGDPECDCFGNKTCPSGRCAPFMAQYQFVEHLASLLIQDSPVGYNPPRGPASFLQLTYHQRQVLQPTTFSFSNAGGSWSIGWTAWIEDNPANLLTPVRTHLGNAGAETSSGLQGSTFGPASRSRAVLVRTSASPIRYERRLPDGSVEVFAQPDGAATFPRRILMTQTIDPQGNALSFTYDAQLRLVAVTDAIGQVSTLSYDLALDPLKITRVTDPFGRTAKLEYNASGRLTRIVDVIGMASSFEYGYGAFVRSMTTPYGTTTFASAQYADIYNHPLQHWVQATDPMGATERMEYHYSNASFPGAEPASAVPTGFPTMNSGLNNHATFYWDKRAWMLYPGDYSKAKTTKWLNGETWKIADSKHSEKLPLESRIWYAYDGNPSDGWVGPLHKKPATVGRVLDDGRSQLRRFEYSTSGKVARETDPLGRQTVYQYSADDIDLVAIKQVRGHLQETLELRSYNALHRPLTLTDSAGQVTTMTYDSLGRLTSTITPARNGPNATPLTIAERTTIQSYYADSEVNGPGMLRQVSGPTVGSEVSSTTIQYDSYGRARTVAGSLGVLVTVEYDALDRVTRRTYPDTSFDQVVYEALDPVKLRDRNGRWSYQRFDAMRRHIAIMDPVGRTISKVWCLCGSLDSLVDANGNAVKWERDAQGRIVSEIRADGTHRDYTYESSSGRLRDVVDAKQQIKRYEYFLDDKIASITYPNAMPPLAAASFSYEPADGRWLGITDGTGTTTFTYYPTGVLGAGKQASVDGPLQSDTVTYSYDELGRVVVRAVNGSANVRSTSFDAFGRAVSVSTSIGTFAFGYLPGTGRLASVGYPNGQGVTHTYASASEDRRKATIRNFALSGQTISRFDYTYDNAGSIADWTTGIDQQPSTSLHHQYDGANQLVSAIRSPVDAALENTFVYTYDAGGNRLTGQWDEHVATASYNSVNELEEIRPGGVVHFRGTTSENAAVSISGQSVQVTAAGTFEGQAPIAGSPSVVAVSAVDPNGNVRTNTYQTVATGSDRDFAYDANGNLVADGVRTYQWDAENRLVAIDGPGAKRTEMSYDHQRHRTAVVERVGGSIVSSKRFVWAGTELLEERDSANNVVKMFFEYGVRVGSTKLFYAKDHLRSIRELVDEGGIVRARYDYDPWGRVTKRSGDLDSDFGYTGHYVREAGELTLTLHRAYDPETGRWLSRDPLDKAELRQGPNLYEYAANDPVNRVDPLGLDAPRCDMVPDVLLEGDCMLECCSIHDKCFKDNGCTFLSFAANLLSICTPCKHCNDDVIGCAIRCIPHPSANNPNQPDCFDAAQNKYVKCPLPDYLQKLKNFNIPPYLMMP